MRTKISLSIIVLFLCFTKFAFSEGIEVRPSESVKFSDILVHVGDNVSSFDLGNILVKKELNNGYTIVKYVNGFISQYSPDGRIAFIGLYLKSDKILFFKGRQFKVQNRAMVEKVLGQPSSTVPVTSKDLYPESVELCIYAKDGVSFQYDLSGKITAVLIFNPSLFGN
jgi:hypothetical protein